MSKIFKLLFIGFILAAYVNAQVRPTVNRPVPSVGAIFKCNEKKYFAFTGGNLVDTFNEEGITKLTYRYNRYGEIEFSNARSNQTLFSGYGYSDQEGGVLYQIGSTTPCRRDNSDYTRILYDYQLHGHDGNFSQPLLDSLKEAMLRSIHSEEFYTIKQLYGRPLKYGVELKEDIRLTNTDMDDEIVTGVYSIGYIFSYALHYEQKYDIVGTVTKLPGYPQRDRLLTTFYLRAGESKFSYFPFSRFDENGKFLGEAAYEKNNAKPFPKPRGLNDPSIKNAGFNEADRTIRGSIFVTKEAFDLSSDKHHPVHAVEFAFSGNISVKSSYSEAKFLVDYYTNQRCGPNKILALGDKRYYHLACGFYGPNNPTKQDDGGWYALDAAGILYKEHVDAFYPMRKLSGVPVKHNDRFNEDLHMWGRREGATDSSYPYRMNQLKPMLQRMIYAQEGKHSYDLLRELSSYAGNIQYSCGYRSSYGNKPIPPNCQDAGQIYGVQYLGRRFIRLPEDKSLRVLYVQVRIALAGGIVNTYWTLVSWDDKKWFVNSMRTWTHTNSFSSHMYDNEIPFELGL